MTRGPGKALGIRKAQEIFQPLRFHFDLRLLWSGAHGGGGAVSLHEPSSLPRLARRQPMFFFDRCQSKYA
jgi:hypothetical protein